jgi:hypothetical protein
MPKNDRTKILKVMEVMPDEAWHWIVTKCISGIYPDGLGGFKPESRKSIEKLKSAATKYLKNFTE